MEGQVEETEGKLDLSHTSMTTQKEVVTSLSNHILRQHKASDS